MMIAFKLSGRWMVWSAAAALGFCCGSPAGAEDAPPTIPAAAAAGVTGAGATPGATAAPGNPRKAQGRSTAQQEAGEPRAGTSQPPPADAPAGVAAPQSAEAAGRGHAVAGQKTAAHDSPGRDSLNLGTATVTGEREQPKVMYIVPWKKSDIGDLSGKPMNSLLDEALAPVDRDEFRREVAYFDALDGKASKGDASKRDAAAPQGEK